MRLLLPLLAACELAEPAVTAPAPLPIDAPAIAPIRSSSVEREAPPPALPPDLVGLSSPVRRWFLDLEPRERHVVRQICRIRAAEPCAGLVRIKRDERFSERDEEADKIDVLLASLADTTHVERFCARTTGRTCMTPLVVSFDGAPIEFLPATARFAFRGEPVATDWPTASTPWIALDRDGDGAITSGAELFGDAIAKHGYAALALLDDNADGVIDRHDPAFARLLLWADADADRRSTPDELSPLASRIVAIPLAHRIERRCAGGNCEGERGVAQLVGGQTGAVVDVYVSTR